MNLTPSQRIAYRAHPRYREQGAQSLPDRAIATKAHRAAPGTGRVATRKAAAAAALNARCPECIAIYHAIRAQGIDVRWKTPRPPNSLERDYAKHLTNLAAAGLVLWWEREAFTFPLAADARFCPDFIVGVPGGFRIDETKGYRFPAGIVRAKVCREKYPQWPLRIVHKRDGEWVST